VLFLSRPLLPQPAPPPPPPPPVAAVAAPAQPPPVQAPPPDPVPLFEGLAEGGDEADYLLLIMDADARSLCAYAADLRQLPTDPRWEQAERLHAACAERLKGLE